MPGDYAWSSHSFNALGAQDPILTPHPLYLALADTLAQRQHVYRQFFLLEPPDQAIADLRRHTLQQRPWGSDRFRREIETLTERAVEVRPRGRPQARRAL